MSDYFIYTFLFEKDEYIQLEGLEKYFLMLMYSNTDDSNKLIKSQGSISELANTSKFVFSRKKKKFKELGLIEEIDKNNLIMKIPADVDHLEKIYINDELINGKYKNLRCGSKLFYIYSLYLQKKASQDYIEYSNVEIKKPFAGSINTIKKYCKELQNVDLLDRIRTSVSHSYHFKEIT